MCGKEMSMDKETGSFVVINGHAADIRPIAAHGGTRTNSDSATATVRSVVNGATSAICRLCEARITKNIE